MEPYRIILAEDHAIFREMIRKSLAEIQGLEVVGEVGDGLELLKAIPKLRPHMVILDIGLPHLSGLEAAEKIKKTHPEIKILMLTMYKTEDHLARALEARVDGYLLKDNAFKDLLTAMETIREGRLYISSLITQLMLDSFAKKPSLTPETPDILSPREKEVLKLLGEGKSDQDIANLLLISVYTVRIHLGNIKDKLRIKKRTELMRYALKSGLASLTNGISE
jgi:two-component system, NarL family, response regulator NreC